MSGTVSKDKRRIRNEGDIQRAKPGTKTLVAGTPGLYLLADKPNNLHPDGLKRFMYRHRKLKDGLFTETGIGHWPLVDLDKAKAAVHNFRWHRQYEHKDPQDLRTTSQGQRKTFAEIAELYSSIHGPHKGDRWHRQFKLFTVTYAGKLTGETGWSIQPDRVREVLAPLFARTWRQGREILSLWEGIFELAKTRGWRVFDNPAKWEGLHEHNFPKPPGLVVKSHPFIPHPEMPAFMQTLRSYQADYVPATALEIGILTGLRPNKEVRLMQWEEINFEGRLLRVPAKRMKKRKNRIEGFFYVPLSPRAIALFLQLKARATGPFVFSVRTPLKPMTESAVIKFFRDTMKIPVEKTDVHGFRTSFRVWGKKNKFDYEALEMCLDHVVGSQTVRAYNRDDLFDERREIMDAWATFLG